MSIHLFRVQGSYITDEGRTCKFHGLVQGDDEGSYNTKPITKARNAVENKITHLPDFAKGSYAIYDFVEIYDWISKHIDQKLINRLIFSDRYYMYLKDTASTPISEKEVKEMVDALKEDPPAPKISEKKVWVLTISSSCDDDTFVSVWEDEWAARKAMLKDIVDEFIRGNVKSLDGIDKTTTHYMSEYGEIVWNIQEQKINKMED